MTRNQIDYWANKEVARHNEKVELENALHNRIVEAETQRHNVKTEMQTDTNLNELIRHQQAVEQETARSNRMQEILKDTANAITAQGNQLNRLSSHEMYLESARHNTVSESQNLLNIASSTSKWQQESYDKAMSRNVERDKLRETSLHNRATEWNDLLRTGASIVGSAARGIGLLFT